MLNERDKIVKMLQELATLLDQIDHQLQRIDRTAFRVGIPASELQTKDGRYLQFEALTTKANVYGSIATLQELLDRIDRAERDYPPRE